MDSQLPGLPAKAPRWIAEMEELAATFDKVGVTPDFHTGAAEVYRLLGETPFAGETPETMDRSRTLTQTIAAVVDRLAPGDPLASRPYLAMPKRLNSRLISPYSHATMT